MRSTGANTGVGTGYRLVRPAPRPVETPVLDAGQRAVAGHDSGPLRLLGGPGTGKTTALVEAVVARVEAGASPDEVLLLSFDRRSAATLRERIAVRLGRTSGEPVARTVHSYAFAVLQRQAAWRGEPPPRLLTGPEQDAVIRELVLGDLEDERGRWPAELTGALRTRGFTAELRDLLLRGMEHGVTADQLRRWGRQHRRPDWVAAARFLTEYAEVTALRGEPALDPAELVQAVLDAFATDPELARRESARFRYLYVDSYEEIDPAQEQLIAYLGRSAAAVVVAGDPDQSVFAFRGADPACLARFPDVFARRGVPAETVVLDRCHRAGPQLVSAYRRAGARLRGRRTHRDVLPSAAPGSPALLPDPVQVHTLRSGSQEASYVAHRLREAHLVEGVPWSRMAVVVRSASRHLPALRRALLGAGVPLGVARDEVPLGAQPAVRSMLTILRFALDRWDGATERDRQAEAEDAAEQLLTSPFGGADALAVRRLRRELRRAELASGGGRSSRTLLREALLSPGDLLLLDERAVEPAARIARLVTLARTEADGGGNSEEVLWAVWAASGLAERWRRDSLAGGTRGAAADADLDAVVALFEAAARLVDRLPARGADALLDHLLGQQIPGDTLADRAPTGDAVRVLTAHSAKGLEWDVVAVVGVQEGLWPDLRPRGSLLGSEMIVDLAAGREPTPVGRVTQMLDEERRLFYLACTRARRRLIVTAVADAESEPSRFLDELVPWTGDTARPPTNVPRALSLAPVVAELRAVVTDPVAAPAVRDVAAGHLARLAAEGVPGASPAEWYGLLPLSDDGPLRGPDEPVRVSPSRVEQFDTCALRWLLETAGGSPGPGAAQGLGTLVHDAATLTADPASATEAALNARVDAGWQGLDLGGPWFADKERERARRMLRKLLGWLRENGRDLVAVEEGFSVSVGRAVLEGRVDRLERDADGRLVVVDLKTGKAAPRNDDVGTNPQLGAYQLAVSLGGFEHVAPDAAAGGAALVQLGTSAKAAKEQGQGPLPDAEDPAWAEELVTRVAEGMAGSVFTAVVNDRCQVCPVRTSCPANADGAQVTT
ncbi:MAG TPA: ATP-dependent DNA helicase [Mycobacteriales bacterium]|nr:ATP-dependent DNA helicase [Mycobacteriales bacterium]